MRGYSSTEWTPAQKGHAGLPTATTSPALQIPHAPLTPRGPLEPLHTSPPVAGTTGQSQPWAPGQSGSPLLSWEAWASSYW